MSGVAEEANMNETLPQPYSKPAMLLHWLMAILLFVQIGIGWYMVDIPKRTPPVAFYYGIHKSLGLIALALVLLRLWWKSRVPAPSPTGLHRSVLQEKAAQASHRMLYACMVMTPLCGIVSSGFTRHGIRFFGYPLPQFGWDDPLIHSVFNNMHIAFSWLLVALIAVHVLAVFYHLSVTGTRIIWRMLPH